jgi:putative transposase
MVLNDVGTIASDIWHALPGRLTHIDLDAFVLMPNHLHGIIVINDVSETDDSQEMAKQEANVRAQCIARNPRRGETPEESQASSRSRQGAIHCARTNPKALGNIMRVYKAVATDRIRRTATPDFRWHRNYYDHIIRDEPDLDRVRAYIAGNPANWPFDRAHRKETTTA